MYNSSQGTTTDSQAIVVIALQEQAQRISSTGSRHQEKHGMLGSKADPVLENAVRTHRAAEIITTSSASPTSKRTQQDVTTFYQQQHQPKKSYFPLITKILH